MKKRQEDALALMADLSEIDKKKAESSLGELANMSFEEMSQYLEYDPGSYNGNPKNGARVFMKAKCMDCHVFGSVGKGGGPDLSTVASRFRRRDILEAIMYPSKVVSDQYTAVRVELKDFTEVTGMVVGEDDKTLTLITINGEKKEISKDTIDKREVSKLSVMPEGLLSIMSLGDLRDLIVYLEGGAN
jgi:putative heme-binding domain-containing protein